MEGSGCQVRGWGGGEVGMGKDGGGKRDETSGWQMATERRGRGRLRQREVRGPDPGRWHSSGGWWTTAGSPPPTRLGVWGALTTSGDGNSSGFWESSACVTSTSPRMARRWRAMTACCSSPQWFSRDRMTGYGDSWRGRGGSSSEPLLRPPPRLPHYTWTLSPFRTGRQRHTGGLRRRNVGHILGPVCP